MRTINQSSKRQWMPTLVVSLGILVHLFNEGTAAAEPISKSNDLERGVTDLAKKIQGSLTAQNLQNSLVLVGNISGTKAPPATGGAEIARILKEQLIKAKLNVATDLSKKPDLEIKGDFQDVEVEEKNGQKNPVALQLEIQIKVRKTGQTLQKLTHLITGEKALATLLGTTTQFDAKPAGKTETAKAEEVQKNLANPLVRNDKIKESLDKPQVTINTNKSNSLISAGTSPYAIEILVAPKPKDPNAPIPDDAYQPVEARKEDGLAFVNLQKDEFYAIRCYNKSEFGAVVQLTIDGLNVFAFKDEDVAPFFFIPKGQSVTVFGWYRTTQASDSFVITEYAKSAAAKQLISEANVGTITAQFSAAWEDPSQMPPDEPTGSKSATGIGARRPENRRIVNVFPGVVRSTVSVRYNKPLPPPKDLPKDAPPPE
jgi:hypothetical protein